MLNEIFKTIQNRKNADPEKSYTAKLFKKGRKKIAQKLGEEAVELIIEAIADKRKNAISESADLLFHLLVLWEEMGITPQDVMEELKTREGISGIDEKNGRK